MKKSLLLALVVLMLVSCGGAKDEASQKKGSSGKTLEMLVVANKDVYYGDTKALIDSLFERPQMCLPQPESIFDIVNIPISSYNNTEMFKAHRNTLILDVSPDNPDKVYMHIDEYAAPQVVFDFAAKSAASLQEMITKYEPRILEEMYKAEHRRVLKAFKGTENYDLDKAVKEKFGFGLTFSDEYALAKEADDFAWIRREAKDFGIGVLIDVLPYTSQSQFGEQQILDRMDTIMKRHVPSSAPDSYMGLERRRDKSGQYLAPIIQKQVEFEGCQYAVETRGCWRSFGDYMGGPFVSYAVLAPSGKKIVMLTAYVYCPRNKPWTKRDLLMQVEGVCWSLNFNK